jgi:adenine phosphoribosyltransferase
LEIAVDALGAGDRVLIVDDWSETGEQLRAAITLIERLGGTVVGAAFVRAEHAVRQDPSLSRYRLHSVLDVY